MAEGTAPVSGDLGFSYELGVDIDTAWPASDTPIWAQLGFISEVQPGNTKNFTDTTTYYNAGAKAQTITGEDWQLQFDYQIQRTPAGLYVSTLAQLVTAAGFGQRNKNAQAHIRFYDTEGADYAYEGYGYVAMTRKNTGPVDVGIYTFTVTGEGALVPIVNPIPAES